jgi:hypothetical protein
MRGQRKEIEEPTTFKAVFLDPDKNDPADFSAGSGKGLIGQSLEPSGRKVALRPNHGNFIGRIGHFATANGLIDDDFCHEITPAHRSALVWRRLDVRLNRWHRRFSCLTV